MTATTDTTTAPPKVSDDVFTEAEAAAFLKLPSVRAFRRRRREAGVTGHPVNGNRRIFAREQLEAIRRHMFGLNR